MFFEMAKIKGRAFAEVLAALCKVPIVVSSSFAEIDFGDWDGLSWEEQNGIRRATAQGCFEGRLAQSGHRLPTELYVWEGRRILFSSRAVCLVAPLLAQREGSSVARLACSGSWGAAANEARSSISTSAACAK